MPHVVQQSAALEIISQPVGWNWLDFLEHEGAHVSPQALAIERAGRTCYKSEGKMAPGTAQRFIKMLEERGHASVIEHCSATYRVITDRGIGNQAVRHRIASYSQESTRYCNYTKEAFTPERGIGVVPIWNKKAGRYLEEGDKGWSKWWDQMCAAEETYFDLINTEKWTPEEARDVMPLCLKTEFVWTQNFRSWVHTICERSNLNQHAHPKMRVLGDFIKASLEDRCPEVFNDIAYHILK